MQSESEEAPFPFELKSVCSSQMMPNGLSERTVVIDISTNGPLDFPSPKKTQSLIDESGRRFIRRRKVVTNQPRKEPDAPLPNARPLKPIRVAEVVENLNRLVETTSYSSWSSSFRSDTSHYYTSAGRNQSSSGSRLDSRTQIQTTINSKMYGQDQRSGSPKLELTEARIVYEKDAKKKRSPQTKNSIMREAELLDSEESLADSSADADVLRFPKQRNAHRSDESSDEPPAKRRKSPERNHRSSRRNKRQRFDSDSSESYESEEDTRKSRRSAKKSHGKEPKEDREDDDRRRSHRRSSQRRRRSPSDSSDEYERYSTRRKGSPKRSRRRDESESESDEYEIEIRRYRTKRHSPKRSTRRRREVSDYSDEERPRKRRGSPKRRRHQVSDSYESSDDKRKKESLEYSDEEGSEKNVAKKEVNETQSMVSDKEEVVNAEENKGVVAGQQTEEEQANEEPVAQEEDKTHEEESVHEEDEGHEEEDVNEKAKDEEKPHLEEEDAIVEAEEEQKEEDKGHSNEEEDAIDKAKEEDKSHSNEEEAIEEAKEEEDKSHSNEEEEAVERTKEESGSGEEEKIEDKSGADKEEKDQEKQTDKSDSNEENAVEEIHKEEEQHSHESGAEDENQSHKSNSSSSTESKPQSPIIVTDELTKSVSLEHDESLHLDELESDSHDEQDILFRPYGRKETTGSFRERSYGLKAEQQTFSHTIGPTSRKLLDGSKSLSSSVELSVKEIHPSSIVYGDSSVWMFLPLDLSGTEDYQKKETDDGKVTLPPNFSRVVVILDHSFGQENRDSLLVPISRAMSPYKSEHFAILVENAESENPNCAAVYTFGYCGDKCTKIWGTGQDDIDISTIRAYWQYKWDKHVFVADEGLGEKTVAFSV